MAWTADMQADQQDCRPHRKTPQEDLTGDWLDQSNNQNVHLAQHGGAAILVKHIVATYVTPVRCKYPGADGQPVFLTVDFEADVFPKGYIPLQGMLEGPMKPYFDQPQGPWGPWGGLKRTVIWGDVFVCFWRETNGTGRTESILRADMFVFPGDDGRSIAGTFRDPVKGTQNITVTRITQPNSDSDPKMQGFVYVSAIGRSVIYQEPSTGSPPVTYAPNAARIMFTDATEQNGQLWYRTRIAGAPPGWISGNDVSCTELPPVPPGPPRPLVDSGLGNHHTISIHLAAHG